MSSSGNLRRAAFAAGLFAAGVIGYARISEAAQADIVIDTATQFQTMEGWEVAIRGWEQNKAENRYDRSWRGAREEVVRRLVDEAGVNRVRLEAFSGAEAGVDHWTRFVDGAESYTSFSKIRYANANDNDDAMKFEPAGFHFAELDSEVETILLPMRERLAARGERLFVNLCIVDFGKGDHGALSLSEKPEEYAEFALATFDHLKAKYGLTPDALEIMLEPENAQDWSAARMGPAISRATSRLRAAGYAPKIIAPSTVHAKNAIIFFNAAERSGAKIDVLSYHSYDRPSDGVRRAIAARAAKSGASTAMLEHLRADVNELYADLVHANVAAWQQWAIANFADNGNYLLVADLTKPAGAQIRLGRRTRYLAQIWRHVRIGDVRIAARAPDKTLKALAFVRRDGGVVVAAITQGPRDIRILGLPAGAYLAEFTTELETGAKNGRVIVGADGDAVLSIPGAGVATLTKE